MTFRPMNRVKLPLFTSALVLLASMAPAETAKDTGATPTNACPAFELKDQFGTAHVVKFPSDRPLLLTVANRKGAADVPAWAHPMAKRFGGRLRIEGLADVSAVPRPLHGFVLGKFKKAIAHPAMLDWDGKLCRHFAYVKDEPNVYVISTNGAIRLHLSGATNAAGLQQLTAAIARELPASSAERPLQPAQDAVGLGDAERGDLIRPRL